MNSNLHLIDYAAVILPALLSVYVLLSAKYIKKRLRQKSQELALKNNNELKNLDHLIENIRLRKMSVNNKELIAALDKYFDEYNVESSEPLNQIRKLEKRKLIIIYKYFLTRNLDSREIQSFEKELEEEYGLSKELVEKLMDKKKISIA